MKTSLLTPGQFVTLVNKATGEERRGRISGYTKNQITIIQQLKADEWEVKTDDSKN